MKPDVLVRIVVACLAFAVARASAQPIPVPEAVRDVAPATLSCGRVGGDPALDKAFAAGTPVLPDLSCGVSIDEYKKLAGERDVLLVDIRPADQYALFKIDGALNLDGAELRSKQWWREKHVILLGSGKGEQELYSLCAQLKAKGYRHVEVLRGGMGAWLGAENPVVGAAPSAASYARLTPGELWAEARFESNTVLIESTQAALRREFDAPTIFDTLNLSRLKDSLKRRSAKAKPLASVVVVLPVPAGDDLVTAIEHALSPVPVLIYTSGAAALKEFSKTQRLVWDSRIKGPKSLPCGR